MTDFTSVSIRPPKDWQAFERHSRLLFEYSLNDSATQNNGRPGQRQHGVDIFGRRGGGAGPLVGIQCKGKDSDYGGVITIDELRREVEKTKKFKPDLKEFILITTAPDDAKIQEEARILEEQVHAAGRDLSISVWGWERVQQEINRFREVLKAFHPDATPFTDLLLDDAAQVRQDSAQIKEMLASGEERRTASEERLFKLIDSRLSPAQISNADARDVADPIDKVLNDQIDGIRNLIRKHQPRTALTLLTTLKDKAWATASNKIRFRILGNLGSAYHSLREYDKAADFFLESFSYNPDQPISYANKVAALLIKGAVSEAQVLAKEGFAKFPDSVDLALQRLQAREENEDLNRLWSDLSPTLKDHPELNLYLVAAFRQTDDPKWRDLAKAALSTWGDDERFKLIYAEAVLDRIFSKDRSALGRVTPDVPEQAEIQDAADILDHAWKGSLDRETPPNTDAAHNGALAYIVLGRTDKARRLLDDSLQSPHPREETKRLRLALYARNESLAEAIKLADTLEDIPQNAIIRAELRLHDSPETARTILKDREKYTNYLDIVGASFVVVDSYLKEEKFDEALVEAQRLQSRLPEDPQSFLTLYRVRKRAAHPDAEEELEQAVSKLTPESDFACRFMIADEMAQIGRWDEVIELLRSHVSTHYDSLSLRALVTAAANGDRREILKSILEKLPIGIVSRPFYRRSRIALAIRVQDIATVEREIRQYLDDNPRSLEMHLQLMHALFRQDKLSELRAEAAKPASAFDGEPLEYLKLAQFKDGFGDWREAHALAYETVLKHFDDPEVNLAYVAVFLHPGHSAGLDINPSIIQEDMAVTLKIAEADASKVFIIESNQALRPTPQYVSPAHPIAKVLLGRELGEEIVLPDKINATIAGIKPKVLHELHEILDNFQRQFPETQGLERVHIDIKRPDGLSEVVERLKQRHDAIESVFGIYEGGLVPIAGIARILSQETVETFVALSGSGRKIRVCEGTQQERDAALSVIRANQRTGCVLDPIALHIVRRLNLDRAVSAVCGPIGTVENRILHVTQKIYELEQKLDEPDLSLSWSKGKAYRHEVTAEQKRDTLKSLRDDRDWMRTKIDILPAQGKGDLPKELNDLVAKFGSDMLDEARSAQGSDRLFICEDYALRVLAASGLKIRTTWLQPVLILAKDDGHLSPEEYRKAITTLIDSRLDFISIDSNILVGSLSPTKSIMLPGDFSKAVNVLGGAKADLRSHLRVAAEAIARFWNDASLPWTLRDAAVGAILESVCRERNLDHIRLIITAFIRFGQRTLKDDRFADYIYGWVKGHFLPIK